MKISKQELKKIIKEEIGNYGFEYAPSEREETLRMMDALRELIVSGKLEPVDIHLIYECIYENYETLIGTPIDK